MQKSARLNWKGWKKTATPEGAGASDVTGWKEEQEQTAYRVGSCISIPLLRRSQPIRIFQLSCIALGQILYEL